jgi:CheY-like chemotaxis protein
LEVINVIFKSNKDININITRLGYYMKPLILVVEDNPDILKYLKMTLEFNECQIITAENGKEGLKALSELKTEPDLIISDIMMPEMNGYDFFNAVSQDPKKCHIPFIFLSALGSDEDIRLGKMLGVDDYLTKPINEDDLMAVISGKIKRSKNTSLINRKINQILAPYEKKYLPEEQKDLIVLLEVVWDDRLGPKLENHFPKETQLEDSLKEIGRQLYDAISSIYGQHSITKAEGLLITVKNFSIKAYVFFDTYPDSSFICGSIDFMLSLVAPNITYLQSLKIKQVFNELSPLYKQTRKWDLEVYWEKFSDVLTKPSI